MPEVKWVDARDFFDSDPYQHKKQLSCAVPVLTLDDLEVWLKAQPDEWVRVSTLLAQVQAMKGKP